MSALRSAFARRALERQATSKSPLSRLSAQWGVLLAVLLVTPFVFQSSATRFLIVTVLVYAGLAVTWNLTLGVAGIANFAHMAFFAVGAYGFAIFVSKTELSPWLGILVGALVAGVSSAIAFIPVIRLRGIYVALVTFVFSQLCFYLVLNQTDITGGSSGLVGLPKLRLGEFKLSSSEWSGYYWLMALVLLGIVILLDLVYRSRFGQSLAALRDNERYAIARGIPPFRQQLLSFIISGSLAGGIGAIYASFVGVVAPEMFGFGYTTLALSIIFLGGIGNARGPLVAAVIVTVVSDSLKTSGPWRFIVISMIIMAVLWFFPTGLAGLWSKAVERIRRMRRAGREGSEEAEEAREGEPEGAEREEARRIADDGTAR